MDILKVENISKIYGNGENAVHALSDVSFSVPKGQFLAIPHYCTFWEVLISLPQARFS